LNLNDCFPPSISRTTTAATIHSSSRSSSSRSNNNGSLVSILTLDPVFSQHRRQSRQQSDNTIEADVGLTFHNTDMALASHRSPFISTASSSLDLLSESIFETSDDVIEVFEDQGQNDSDEEDDQDISPPPPPPPDSLQRKESTVSTLSMASAKSTEKRRRRRRHSTASSRESRMAWHEYLIDDMLSDTEVEEVDDTGGDTNTTGSRGLGSSIGNATPHSFLYPSLCLQGDEDDTYDEDDDMMPPLDAIVDENSDDYDDDGQSVRFDSVAVCPTTTTDVIPPLSLRRRRRGGADDDTAGAEKPTPSVATIEIVSDNAWSSMRFDSDLGNNNHHNKSKPLPRRTYSATTSNEVGKHVVSKTRRINRSKSTEDVPKGIPVILYDANGSTVRRSARKAGKSKSPKTNKKMSAKEKGSMSVPLLSLSDEPWPGKGCRSTTTTTTKKVRRKLSRSSTTGTERLRASVDAHNRTRTSRNNSCSELGASFDWVAYIRDGKVLF